MAEVYLQGMDKLMRKLDAISRGEAVQDGLKKACRMVETAAKEKCPVDDGTLKASITHSVEYDKGIVGTNVEYGPYVEFGTGLFAEDGNGRKDVPWRYQDAKGNWHTTSGQKPNPFLQNAIEKKQDEVRKQFEGLV